MRLVPSLRSACAFTILFLSLLLPANAAQNLLPDPGFELTQPKDRWGLVFQHWGGWVYEGQCEFRVSQVAHSGRHSLLMVAGSSPKVRASAAHFTLDPGRYRITAWLRGLDIGTGVWNQTTEFMFEEKYMPLHKNGTFGWTPLTFVGEVTRRREFGHPSFGLMAPGYLWVDDVTVEKVGPEVPLTPEPVLGREEKPVAPPADVNVPGAVRCSECGYRNLPAWGRCYACGTPLDTRSAIASGPAVKQITSFEEEKNPFEGGRIVSEHATDRTHSLFLDRGYAILNKSQDWTGYDYLKADVHTDSKVPLNFYVEIRDSATRDYWTRVNYNTIVPPGSSTLIIPTSLYVGEKSRPGRPLILNAITHTVFSIGDKAGAPLFIDNIRLERDTETPGVLFNGLFAFDLGTGSSPLMEGFTSLDMTKTYSTGRGYGWKNARFWRAFDSLQPDPLYQDFICVESGGLAIDVPNGRYHVFVNMDSPSGFWGEYQHYRRRSLIVEGIPHEDTMTLESLARRYFRFWNSDDLPTESTFEKYQLPYFNEKQVDVDVTDGQLNIDFNGENWACSVSAIIVYPESKAADGRRFLDFVKARRQFHFDNYFKRVLHQAPDAARAATVAEQAAGFIAFARDPMQDTYYNDRPAPDERLDKLTASAFPGEMEPVTLSVLPLRDLGRVTVSASDLVAPGSSIPSSQVDIGFVSYRLSRVTMEGSVYTIAPRSILPQSTVAAPKNIARTFWLTVRVPTNAAPVLYRGTIKIASSAAGSLDVPFELAVHKGTLDPVDIPMGPWSHTIDLPWFGDEAVTWNNDMALKSLRKLREYGFTTCSGLPVVSFRGFKNGAPVLDFTVGDAQMRRLRQCGFDMPVVSYCAFNGLNTYFQDSAAMKAAGFTNYSDFIRALFGAIQAHADASGWLPVYWNLGDEPLGDDTARSAENAEAYRKAFPQGPPFFTAASSFRGTNRNDPHFRLSKALHVADWNDHDEPGVQLLHDAGADWAFYNGGNRWTYGIYAYKAAKEFGMKFRLSWHWNAAAGDPYYALDCREDDYAWCTAGPNGQLIPSIHFEQLREGIDDYRRLLTLARLTKERSGSPAATAAAQFMSRLLASFKLGDRDLPSGRSYREIRSRLDASIDLLSHDNSIQPRRDMKRQE